MKPGYLFWFFPIVGPHEVAAIRPRNAEYPLEFKAGDNIGMVGVMVGIETRRIENPASGCEYHRSDLQFSDTRRIRIQDCPSQADLFAKAAADAALGVNGIDHRYGLGVRDVGGSSAIEASVVIVCGSQGAGMSACTTARAFGSVNIARGLAQLGDESARPAVERFDF